MRPDTPALCTSRLLQMASTRSAFFRSRSALRRRVGLAVALLVMFAIPGALFAQQADDNGQYEPNVQSGDQVPADEQPGYAQPQPYGQHGQQSSPQQAYPQQSFPDAGQMDAQPGDAQPGYDQAQPLGAQDIEQLVAPIALYPDALVAQVLTASTYPEQVAEADRWRRQEGYAPSDQIADGADAQPWDPSVKALTAFPQVLTQMDQNLHWTTELGEAYYNQPQDVLQAVQVMRRRAQAAGNLQSTPQEEVNYDQGNIVLAPANPQVVYVPAYNPWAVYGAPIAPYPGFSLLAAVGSFIGSAFGPVGVRFGLGIAMTAFTHTPFGLLAWGLDWLAHSVLFQGSSYFSHSRTVADWGLPHGGPRAFGRDRGFGGWAGRSYRAQGGYGRGGYSGVRSQGFARTPDRDAYARNRSGNGYGRSTPGSGYGRTSQTASNRFQSAGPRPEQYRSQQFRSQQYGRSGYGSGSYNRSAENYGRAGTGQGNSIRSSRAPSSNFQRSGFGSRSSGGFRGNSFAQSSGKRSHSGASHFGGGHAPKGFGGGKTFGHGHSGGGGHSGGHGHSGGGKHHH